MIKTTDDRNQFIGGSEANMIYMNYESTSFKKWWASKLSESPSDSFSNIHMSVGTILEHDILDLYERINKVKGIRDAQKVKGIARANTDYILGNKVSDVKATKKAFEWFLKEKVPLNYKRQLIHYMYIFDLREASVIAYQVDKALMINPFDQLAPSKLFEVMVPVTTDEITVHKQKIDYLEHCKSISVFPK
ncbi:YqaJ viral recombinase family protein [Siminovitchia sp. FSL W7-1587]|uniref:YqaJ viral recombinase family protein n=1 Tax=Siminovitchia sp. FSL W7-1587 TaxID=2954699 RepID=UPI0030CBD500